MLTLDELGEKYGTDKLAHRYLQYYAERFEPLRSKPVRLCEIGTWQGASVKMWRDYFYNPEARIVGFDHSPEWLPGPKDEITVEIGSQEDAAFQVDFGRRYGPFDIIIDDGGHKPQQHLASLAALWGFVVPGGWHCIEDVQSIYDICWNESGCEKTIFDWLTERWKEIVIGGSDVQEVTVVGGNWNDGLVFLRKRWQPYTPRS